MKKFKMDEATFAALLYTGLIGLTWTIGGCAFDMDKADPSARSARATYGNITITASEKSTVNITLGDGALAAADGAGETSQSPTMTTSQSPSVSVQMPAGMDPVSAGINGVVTLASKGMDTYAARAARDAAMANAAGKPSVCTGPACSEAPCTGPACSDSSSNCSSCSGSSGCSNCSDN